MSKWTPTKRDYAVRAAIKEVVEALSVFIFITAFTYITFALGGM